MKQDDIGREIGAVSNMIRRKLDIIFSGEEFEELTGKQNAILGFILNTSAERDVFQKDVERCFNIRGSSATAQMQNLEEKGFIVRVPVASDARLKKIVATEKAAEMHARMMATIDGFSEVLEAGITPEEKKEFLRILNKIRTNLEEGDRKC